MELHFGASFFLRESAPAFAARTRNLLTRFADAFPDEDVRGHGMFAGSGKFSRMQRLDARSAEELASGVLDGRFCSLLAFAGNPGPIASLSVEVQPYPDVCSVDLVTRARDLEWSQHVHLARKLWSLLEASYAFTLWGNSDSEVRSELTGVPIQA